MSRLLFVGPANSTAEPPVEFALLNHVVKVTQGTEGALTDSEDSDLVVLDARVDLGWAKTASQTFNSAKLGIPMLLLLTVSGLPVLSADWGARDFILEGAPPAELEARIRLAQFSPDQGSTISGGPIEIDEAGYSATLDGHAIDLTYTEFELLKYLVLNPGRVLTRETLLSEVWGYDYFGGTRTVDVHIRRLRAKLGNHDSCISTVRNVGYRFSPR